MEQKWRVCLKCDKGFFSESSGNRICGKCKHSNCKIHVLKPVPYIVRRRGSGVAGR